MELVCNPIGLIHTDKRVKFETPHQPLNEQEENNIIELFPDCGYERALRDIDGFERIWLVWWFDRNTNWRPLVMPPRGSEVRRGVFATRSPHRPCPIGITTVPLISVAGRTLVVGNVDLLDKTPILDIKPYISEIDSFPDQRQGWLEEVVNSLPEPQYTVILSPLASEHCDWLKKNWNISFIERAMYILERAPFRSRANRITAPKEGVSRLSSGAWRVFFKVEDQQVVIQKLLPGYPKSLLYKEGFEIIPDWEAQRNFLEVW